MTFPSETTELSLLSLFKATSIKLRRGWKQCQRLEKLPCLWTQTTQKVRTTSALGLSRLIQMQERLELELLLFTRLTEPRASPTQMARTLPYRKRIRAPLPPSGENLRLSSRGSAPATYLTTQARIKLKQRWISFLQSGMLMSVLGPSTRMAAARGS